MKYLLLITALWCAPAYASEDTFMSDLGIFLLGAITGILLGGEAARLFFRDWVCTKQVRVSKEGDLPEEYTPTQYTKKGHEE